MIVSYIRTSTDKQQNSIDTQIDTIESIVIIKELDHRNIMLILGSLEKHVIVPNSMIF